MPQKMSLELKEFFFVFYNTSGVKQKFLFGAQRFCVICCEKVVGGEIIVVVTSFNLRRQRVCRGHHSQPPSQTSNQRVSGEP